MRIPILTLALLVVAASLPRIHSARADLGDELRKLIEQQRQAADSRTNAWQRDREERYRRYREAARNQDPRYRDDRARNDHSIRLQDPRIAPGQYRVEEPGGASFQIVVPKAGQAGRPDPQSFPGRGVDVVHLAESLSESARSLAIGLQNAGLLKPVNHEFNLVRENADKLKRMVRDGDEPQKIRVQFANFDKLWHPVAHKLDEAIPRQTLVRRQFETVNQLDGTFHRLLQVEEAPIYDRLRVAALTQQLELLTNNFYETLARDRGRPAGGLAMRRQARRVAQHAADLAATVRETPSFYEVVDEFQQFDEAWHRLEDRRVSSPLRVLAQKVWVIDSELHKQLLVDPVVHTDRAQLVNLTEGLAESAAHLVRDLRYDFDERSDEQSALYAAQDFAWAANDLHERFEDEGPRRQRIRALNQAWSRLQTSMGRLDKRRHRHAFEVLDRLEKNVGDLDKALDGYSELHNDHDHDNDHNPLIRDRRN